NEALVNNRFAWFLAVCPDSGLRDPARAVQLARKAMQLWPVDHGYRPDYYRTLIAPYLHAGTNWTTLGVAHYRAGQWKEAVAALEHSIERRLDGDSIDWFFLAMVRWRLGEKDKARESYDRAVQWMEKNKPKNEELRRFRAEAAELLELKEMK